MSSSVNFQPTSAELTTYTTEIKNVLTDGFELPDQQLQNISTLFWKKIKPLNNQITTSASDIQELLTSVEDLTRQVNDLQTKQWGVGSSAASSAYTSRAVSRVSSRRTSLAATAIASPAKAVNENAVSTPLKTMHAEPSTSGTSPSTPPTTQIHPSARALALNSPHKQIQGLARALSTLVETRDETVAQTIVGILGQLGIESDDRLDLQQKLALIQEKITKVIDGIDKIRGRLENDRNNQLTPEQELVRIEQMITKVIAGIQKICGRLGIDNDNQLNLEQKQDLILQRIAGSKASKETESDKKVDNDNDDDDNEDDERRPLLSQHGDRHLVVNVNPDSASSRPRSKALLIICTAFIVSGVSLIILGLTLKRGNG